MHTLRGTAQVLLVRNGRIYMGTALAAAVMYEQTAVRYTSPALYVVINPSIHGHT